MLRVTRKRHTKPVPEGTADGPQPDTFFAPISIDTERRTDGVLLLRNNVTLPDYPATLIDRLRHWATNRPGVTFLAERVDGRWRSCSYGDFWERITARAARILAVGCSAERPLMILSPNSIEHAALAFGAMRVGVPVAPISLAYASAPDFRRLREVAAQLTPGLIYIAAPDRFSATVAALGEYCSVFATPENFVSLPSVSTERLTQAERGISSATVAKLLFTSGSTGHPKAVENTHGMMCSNQAAMAQLWPGVLRRPPVLVDWLPWNHTFGGNFTLNFALFHGGSYYIDDGRPTPALEKRTAINLRSVAPTVYFNVPAGFEALIPHLERDLQFARHFFVSLDFVFSAAAALPQTTRDRLTKLALQSIDRPIPILAGWGSTETAPCCTLVYYGTAAAADIGLPLPGTRLKLAPVDEKLELRVAGPNVMTRYWRQTESGATAFDEEGFYRMGDAGKLFDPERPEAGICFDGRIAENFKLHSGTWVNVGALRLAVIEIAAPLIMDAVVTGHDQNEIGLLIFLNFAACRTWLGEEFDPETLVKNERLLEWIQLRLTEHNRANPGSSSKISCFRLQSIPPQPERLEITDKGYVNQRAVITARAQEIELLYHSRQCRL
jgi:feruloyl-CoA synthase